MLLSLFSLIGAMDVALGAGYTGVFSNSDELFAALDACGKRTGDPVWRMPLGEHYRKQIGSHVADLKNVGNRRYVKVMSDAVAGAWSRHICDLFVHESSLIAPEVARPPCFSKSFLPQRNPTILLTSPMPLLRPSQTVTPSNGRILTLRA